MRDIMNKKTQIASSTTFPRNDKVTGGIASAPAALRNDKVGLEIASTTAWSRNDKKKSANDKAGVVPMFVFAAMMSVCGMGMAAEVAVMGAGEAAKVELPSKLKEITGTVIAKTRMNLSVETSRQGSTAFEMVLPFDKTTKLRGYRHFDEISRGDTIKAVCKQTYEVQKDGSERIMGTVAAQISLVKSSSQGRLTSKER